ncbi:MAG: tyrosine phosphatase family protein [Methyloligellaceae bacterium]
MQIFVCGLDDLNDIVVDVGASHVVTLLNHDTMPDTPRPIAQENHLKLAMNDISEPAEGLVLPNTLHISNLIGFLDTWPKVDPIVIHCWAGISRSTAAAFISQCFFNPSVDEIEIAMSLRRASPSATPNRRLVELADEVLDRGGRMRKAIEEIGRGELAQVGEPFSLPVEIRRV